MNSFICSSERNLLTDAASPHKVKYEGKVVSICRSANQNEECFYIITNSFIYKLNANTAVTNKVFYYTPNQKKMYRTRREASSIVFRKKIYIVGGVLDVPLDPVDRRPGITSHSELLSRCDKVNLFKNRLKKCSELNIPRSHSGIASTHSSIYILGGLGKLFLLCSIEKYIKKTWVCLSCRLPTPISNFAVISISDSRLLIIGGRKPKAEESNMILEYRMSQKKFVQISSLQQPSKIKSYNACYTKGTLEYLDTNDKNFKVFLDIEKWHDRKDFLTLRLMLRVILI